MEGFIAIHLGAGRHSPRKDRAHRRLCDVLCQFGLQQLSAGENCRSVVSDVAKLLEKSPMGNSGYGSSLNCNGVVQCDGSMMETELMVGTAVGACGGVASTVEVANALQTQLREPRDKWGRSKPLFLAGKDVEEFAINRGLALDSAQNKISEEAQRYYDHWTEIINSGRYPCREGEPHGAEITDTIGIICRDNFGQLCIASASGGNALKPAGRIGCAGVVGAGIDILKDPISPQRLVAAATSGHGEDIITARLASTACVEFLSNDFEESASFHSVHNRVKSLPFLQSDPPYFGLMVVTQDEATATLNYAHTTESMIIAYGSLRTNSTNVIISRNESADSLTFSSAAL
ncbi:hypothetical protein TRVA0_043S00496 [Trichomonascus vanleenenianus]|uniref:threonine aspartase 1 n=1 Tax=Trichomonascus vanleenenianus TaxID=2268995 RepID=UPI003ECB31AF